METESSRKVAGTFPLRLQPSIRETAKAFSEKEGVSLNQFINVAVAEKVSQLRHEEWVRNRRKPSPEEIAEVLRLLDKTGGQPPLPGDELPAGYVPLRERLVKKSASG